ncbi:MAG: rubrerythrin family protein [Thermovirgaceae bacterium]
MSKLKSHENLLAAFAGESQANRKYAAFAQKAEEEGFTQVAKLFRVTAEAESIHANAHLKAMGKIGSTADNLKAAIEGETYEFSEMYPEFIEVAETEEDKAALRAFKYAIEAEKIHAKLYKKTLENLGSNENVDLHLCTVCGHIAEESAPDICPLCGAKKQAFKKVE